MKVKICGIKNFKEAEILNETMPDFGGFVFAKSKREVSYDVAFKIKEILDPKIKRVGVFVDKTLDEIVKYKPVIEYAQLHGDYSDDDVKFLKDKGFGVIYVVRVLKKEYEINTDADFLLFDKFCKNQYGGTNQTFDWDIKISANVPYFVAGGICAQNIMQMNEKLHPYGVDISSGAEENGIKTKQKVSNIIEIIRGIKNE